MVSLTCETPPSVDVVSLAEVKAHLFISDSESDTHLSALIAAAAAACSIYCGRGLGLATYVYTLDEFPSGGNRIRLPVTPLVADQTTIAYVDVDGASRTIDAADLLIGLRTGQVAPADWNRPEAVTVTFQAGKAPASLPKQAKQAILLTVGHYWANRGDEIRAADPTGSAALPVAARFLLDQLKSGSLD